MANQPACFDRRVYGTNTKTFRAALARVSPVEHGQVRVHDAKLGEENENRFPGVIFVSYYFLRWTVTRDAFEICDGHVHFDDIFVARKSDWKYMQKKRKINRIPMDYR